MIDIISCMNFFQVSERELNAVVAAAMSRGASYSDLYFENVVSRNLMLRDGVVSSCGLHQESGVGIRVLDGEKTGYSYCETTALPDMLRAAGAAAGICAGIAARPSATSAIRIPSSDFYPVIRQWEEVDNQELISFLLDLDSRLRSKDSRISKVVAGMRSSDDKVMMYNSLGELCCDFRPMSSLFVSIVFSNGKVTENRTAGRSFRMGAEMLGKDLMDDVVEELCGGIEPMLEAECPKGGSMPVVMAAGASGILLHEAMGHAFEADFNRKGTSIFSDKMGQRVCMPGINVIDDATLPGNRGACNFDDEGVPGQKTYMVTDGILTSYLHDRISAVHYGVAPTGNGRRESFRFEPIPRMRLTYMDAGNVSPDDIVASVKQGVYVSEFSNGQVKIGEGDFTFFVKLGYLIENGRLTKPVKDINVIGNGPRALSDIQAVGNDLKISDGNWLCGKEQMVPVGCGMPTVLVSSLTVGGRFLL